MSKLKIEAARRQLGTALHLHLRDLDPVSVHCLANGGCELIDFHAEKAGGKPFRSHILQTVTDTDIEEIRTLQRQYWTAFKHATYGGGKERSRDDALLKRFTDKDNDAALFIGWHDYAQATKTMPIEAQVHQIWFLALHPDKLDPSYSIKDIERYFPKLPTKSRTKQKRMLNKAIERARSDRRLMRDPGTDARPLVLEWSA